MIIQKRMRNGKTRSVNFNDQTSAQNSMELMENQWSSSRIFSKDSHRLRFSDKWQKGKKTREIKPGQFEGQNSIHVLVQ